MSHRAWRWGSSRGGLWPEDAAGAGLGIWARTVGEEVEVDIDDVALGVEQVGELPHQLRLRERVLRHLMEREADPVH